MAACDKSLADYGKRQGPDIATLPSMSKKDLQQLNDIETGDFAVVGIHGGTVVLEANEWDLTMGLYRVVTLYLSPSDARQIAEQLIGCASGADHDGTM